MSRQHEDGLDQEELAKLKGDEESRLLWETRERLAEVESQLVEAIEREHILELELAALRRDVDVRVARNASLEEAAEERRRHVEWLQSRCDSERERSALLAKEVAAVAAELAAERARLSYRLFQRAIVVVRPPRRR